MFRAVFLAFLAALLVGFQPAAAQPRRAPGVVPLDRVLPNVRSRYPGTFYDADGPYMDERGSPHYRLKWMTPQGRVIWLDTDARTGRVLGVEHGARRGEYAAPPPGERAPPPGYFQARPRGRYYDEYPGGRGFERGNGWERGAPRGNWNGPGGWGGRGGHGGHGHGH